MKRVRIGGVSFSKVLCGANAFYGHSHFSEARDAEYRGRFDDAMIERVILRCLEFGVNAVESCANERILSIVARAREQSAEPVRFVGSTRVDETSDMKTHPRKMSFLVENRADLCVVHAQYADRPRKDDAIVGLERLLDKAHEAGLLAGISTHRVETVELCEKRGYPVDAYLFPLNPIAFCYPGYAGSETVRERVDLVRGVAKPFILIKALAAGRIPPDEGLHFIAENAKPEDLVSIGFGTEEEAAETLEIAEKVF